MTPRSLCASAISVAVACFAASQAVAQFDQWRPYTELEARMGDDVELGLFELFFPLWQDQDSMLFVDARGYQDDVSASEGNWGLAFRTMLPSDWVLGVNGFFDYRRTEFGNDFSQGAFGLELLDIDKGFRLNGYIPDGEVKSAPGATTAAVSGGTIAVLPGLEASYYGLDAEAECLLWHRDGCRLGGLDLELWGAAGVYHFDHNRAGFTDITGPRLRTELRAFDLPWLGNDSRLVFGARYEHDDVRDSQWTGSVGVRIPFGPVGGRSGRRLQGLARRMVAPIERDIDIVTNVAAGAPEAAVLGATGQVIQQVVTIDANTVNPETVVSSAGANSVVYADGAAGMINTASSINLNNGQVIAGGGSQYVVFGASSGDSVTVDVPGSRPTINNSNFGVNTVVVSTDASVVGLDIVGGNIGVATTTGGNAPLSSNSAIVDNTVSGAGGGYSSGDIGGLINGNTFTGNASFGLVGGQVFGEVSENTATGNGGFGIGVSNVFGVVANNTANGNFGFGLIANDSAFGAVVSGNTASMNTDDGILLGFVGGFISENTSTGNGDSGFLISGIVSGGRFTGNTASGNANDGFGFGQIAAGGLMDRNTATGNTDNGFVTASTVLGTLRNNTSSGNGSNGFVMDTVGFGGQVFNNNADGNTANGFAFFDVNGSFSNNVSSNNGSDGYFFQNVNAGSFVSQNLAVGNGGVGFRFTNVGGVFSNNSASRNGIDGYDFTEVLAGAEMSGNTATENTANGFCFIDVTGTFSDNVAQGNGIDGYDFVDVNSAGLASNNFASGNTNNGFDFVDVEGEFTSTKS
ncbi:MAG: right-handed parallel beta-helix repeat-containing protein [Planctomycetota bacterium]